VSNYSLSLLNAEKGQRARESNVTENNGIKSYIKPSRGNINGGKGDLVQARQLIDDGEKQHHVGNDTYNGKWKESILYTTAFYNDSPLLDILKISCNPRKRSN